MAYAVGRSITNGEAGVAHAYLGHAVRAAVLAGGLSYAPLSIKNAPADFLAGARLMVCNSLMDNGGKTAAIVIDLSKNVGDINVILFKLGSI